MRKLASIQQIKSIEPIEGADRIEIAKVEGWQCVVTKYKFKPGDLAVYFEIDSFLPTSPQFEFLRKSCFVHSELLGDGFKLRTIKLRGTLSQGLLMPLSEFPQLEGRSIGDDVSAELGVREWQIPIPAEMSDEIVGPRPAIIPYSDEMRVQVGGEELIREFHRFGYYITTKMDGSSHGICVDEDGVFHAASHRMELRDNGKGFWKLIHERGLDEKLIKYRTDNHLNTIAVVGEYCGPGIQKNRIGLTSPEWYIFTIEVNGKRVGLDDMILISEELEEPLVPVEEVGHNFDKKYPTVDAVLARADGMYNKNHRKEGIVVRPKYPVMSKTVGGYLSMKAVSNKYLLSGN